MSTHDHLLIQFPEIIQARFWQARQWLLKVHPEFQEEVDLPAKVVGYGLGPGYKGSVCTLILSQKGLKLGLTRSAEFPDPHGLLEGTGKVHRYVVMPPEGPHSLKGLAELLECAVGACQLRMKN